MEVPAVIPEMETAEAETTAEIQEEAPETVIQAEIPVTETQETVIQAEIPEVEKPAKVRPAVIPEAPEEIQRPKVWNNSYFRDFSREITDKQEIYNNKYNQ